MKRIQQLLLGLSSMVLVTNVFAYDIYYHGAREQAIKEQFELQGYILEMEAEQRDFIGRQKIVMSTIECFSNVLDVKEKKWGPAIEHNGTQIELFRFTDNFDKIRIFRHFLAELHLPMDERWKKNELKLFQQIPSIDRTKIPEGGHKAMIEEPYYAGNKKDPHSGYVRLKSFLKVYIDPKINNLVVQRALSGMTSDGKYHRIAETYSQCGGGNEDVKVMTYAQYRVRYADLIKQRGY